MGQRAQLLLPLLLPLAMPAALRGAASAPTPSPGFVPRDGYSVRTQHFLLGLHGNGSVAQLRELGAGGDLGRDHAAAPPRPFLWVSVDGTWYPVESLLHQGSDEETAADLLVAQFGIRTTGGSAVNATLGVRVVNATFLELTALGVGGAVDALRFGSLALAMPRHGNGDCQNGFPMAPCDYLSAAHDNVTGGFGAMLLPLSPLVGTAVDRASETVQILEANTRRQLPLLPPLDLGLTGPMLRAVLWAGPWDAAKDALRKSELAFDLPRPQIDGLRAKDSPIMRTGYFDGAGSWGANWSATAISLARSSGLPYVMLRRWENSSGHFEINREVFPGGDDSLRDAVAELHAAGLRVCLHFLGSLVDYTDSYVTPIPHPDLAIDAELELAEAIGPSATFVQTRGAPTTVPWMQTYWDAPLSSGITNGATSYQFDTRHARIGDEIVAYSAANASGLLGVTRGALGTAAGAHEAGAQVRHMVQMYTRLVPRPGSSLATAMAARLAYVYNYVRADMVYIDGAEGLAALEEPRRHELGALQVPISLFVDDFYKQVNRDILVESSSIVPYTWWHNARANTGDYANLNPKAYLDVQKVRQCDVHWRNLMNPEVGWWGLDAGGVSYDATTPDEIEYMASSSVGLGINPEIGGFGAGVCLCVSVCVCVCVCVSHCVSLCLCRQRPRSRSLRTSRAMGQARINHAAGWAARPSAHTAA